MTLKFNDFKDNFLTVKIPWLGKVECAFMLDWLKVGFMKKKKRMGGFKVGGFGKLFHINIYSFILVRIVHIWNLPDGSYEALPTCEGWDGKI